MAHPAFSDLFIDVSSLEEGLLIRRRNREGKGDSYAYFASGGGDYEGFASSREDFLGRGKSLPEAQGHFMRARGISGSQITPCAYLRRSVRINAVHEEVFCGRKAESAAPRWSDRNTAASGAERQSIGRMTRGVSEY
jgi:hypothetical protein